MDGRRAKSYNPEHTRDNIVLLEYSYLLISGNICFAEIFLHARFLLML